MHQATLAQYIEHRAHLAIFKLRHRHEHRAHAKRFFNVDERFIQRVIGIIELIYEQNCTHAGFAQFAKRCKRLRLNTTCGTHHKHSAFHSRKRHIDFGTKVDMPRRINKIEPCIFPFEMRHATFNRDATFLFFGHVVHRG